ncbi:MAG: mechanosensitive ion channel [Anaerolineae bacterium]|nr:mechanosensitive ion channel [Anaerolineae bacterium]
MRGIAAWWLTTGLRITVILMVAGVTWYAVQTWLERLVMRVPFDSDDRRERARTLARAVRAVLGAVIVAAATLSILSALNIPVGPLLASAGITGLAIAVGSQALVRDFVAGVFILAEGQFSLGDVIRAAGVTGTVERITMRTVWLRDQQGQVHVVPNSAITVMSNLTREWSRGVLRLTFALDHDLREIQRALEAMADRLTLQEGLFGGFLEPPLVVGPVDFTAKAVSFELTVKVLPAQLHTLERRMRLVALEVVRERELSLV